MRHINRRSRQRGAALIVGLVLLAVITLLAVVGMNISNSELASANSEQIRVRAFQAAETGIEYGLIAMKGIGTTKEGEPVELDPKGVKGSPEDEDGNPIDTFTNTLTYHGMGTAPGYSVTDFGAFHYAILSEGKSVRNTLVANEIGAFKINNIVGADYQALAGTNGAL